LIEAPTVKRLMASRSYVCPSALLTDMPSEHLHRTRAIRMMLFHASAGFRRKSELLGNPASYAGFWHGCRMAMAIDAQSLRFRARSKCARSAIR
jgi:hypothetical protein